MAGNFESTTKFKADISQLKSAMQEAKRSVSLANAEFKNATAGMDKWSKSSDGLKAKLSQLDKNLASQKTILENLKKQYQLTAKEMGEDSAQAQKLAVQIKNQEATVKNTEANIKKYDKSLQDVSKAEQLAQKSGMDFDKALAMVQGTAQHTKGSMDSLNEGFTVAKGVMADLVATGIKVMIDGLKELGMATIGVGSDFSTSMSQVQAISGASADELAQLEATAREFGSTTVFSASESAQALKYMSLAGWDAEQSSKALGGVLNLASAGAMDLAQASDLVTDYMSAFGISAEKSAYFADVLAYAQGNANTSVEQLGQAFQNASANMSASGQDFETTTALISAMSNQGLKGARAGTALSAMMRDLTAKMENGKIAIGDTVIEVQDAEGNFRDLTDILKDVETATNGMGNAQKASALQSVFTADSIKGINLVLNEGVDSIAGFEEELRNSTGTAEEMADIMSDNLAGDVKEARSALEELALKLYDKLEPALRDGMDAVKDIIAGFDEWLGDPKNQKAIENLAKGIGDFVENGLKFLQTAFQWILDNGATLTTILTGIGTAFLVFKIGGAIMTLVSAFQALFFAVQAGVPIMTALNVVMNANPILLIITLIAGLVVAFITLWNTSDEFRQFWIDLWDSITEKAKKAWESITKFFSDAWTKIKEVWSGVKDWFSEKWTGIKNVFSSVGTWFRDKFAEAWTNIKNVFSGWANFFGGLWNTIKDKFSSIGTNISDAIGGAVKSGINGVISRIESTINSAIGIINGAINLINKLPGVSVGSVGTVSFPRLARGGVLKRGQVGLLEGDGAEAVVPLEKNTQWIKRVADEVKNQLYGANNAMGGGIVPTGNNSTYNYTQIINSPKAPSRLDVYRNTKNLLGYATGGA